MQVQNERPTGTRAGMLDWVDRDIALHVGQKIAEQPRDANCPRRRSAHIGPQFTQPGSGLPHRDVRERLGRGVATFVMINPSSTRVSVFEGEFGRVAMAHACSAAAAAPARSPRFRRIPPLGQPVGVGHRLWCKFDTRRAPASHTPPRRQDRLAGWRLPRGCHCTSHKHALSDHVWRGTQERRPRHPRDRRDRERIRG